MSDDADRRPEDFARRLGRSAARLRHAARDVGRKAQPEVERRAQEAREAARRAQPEVERRARNARNAARPAAERAIRYAREHENELTTAGTSGARFAASRLGPPGLRPVIYVVTDALTRARLERRNRASSADEGEKPEPPRFA